MRLFLEADDVTEVSLYWQESKCYCGNLQELGSQVKPVNVTVSTEDGDDIDGASLDCIQCQSMSASIDGLQGSL